MLRASLAVTWLLPIGAVLVLEWRTCADGDPGLYLVAPLLLFALVTDVFRRVPSVRDAGIVIALGFATLVLLAVFDAPPARGECDRKGNDLGGLVFFLQLYVVPVAWLALTGLLAAGALAWRRVRMPAK